MGDWGLSLLLIFSTVVHEISAVHGKPFPWQSRHGFLSSSEFYSPTQYRKTPSGTRITSNPFSIQGHSRQKLDKTPFQFEQLNPHQRCVKKANDHTSASRFRDLIVSLGAGGLVKHPSLSASNRYHQSGLRRSTRSQVNENHFLLPFLQTISSHFGEYLRRVLGCQAEHRTYVAQPRSSRLSAPSVDPIQSISSSSSSLNEQPQSHSSLISERSAPQVPNIPILPPFKQRPYTKGKTESQEPRTPIFPSTRQVGHHKAPSTASFPKSSVSPSRPIQRSPHIDKPLEPPRIEDIVNTEEVNINSQSSRSDSSVPQPFEELPFSPPPVDMSGLPPPVFASSDSSASSLPDIVQTISDSSSRFTPVNPSITFTSPGLQPHRMSEVSLLPTTADPTGSSPPPSSPVTTLSLTSHPSHTSHPPPFTSSTMTSSSRLSANSQPGQSQGTLYFGPPGSDVKVLVEANGVLRQWRIAVPPMFGIIDLLRYLAREQAEPINLSTLDPHCFVLTRMLGLRIDESHIWTVTVITLQQEVIFQDRCLPSSNLFILPGYTLVFRYTQT
ncbi:mucin-2-like [Lytechinus variegatus]|uniref:mucin-2-like n=1 Tax=Lytechinus variegatus TaxID=7654 RepID=UPI001BB27E9E|nr:mucin-2-like [Lytechinus variegatus]